VVAAVVAFAVAAVSDCAFLVVVEAVSVTAVLARIEESDLVEREIVGVQGIAEHHQYRSHRRELEVASQRGLLLFHMSPA